MWLLVDGVMGLYRLVAMDLRQTCMLLKRKKKEKTRSPLISPYAMAYQAAYLGGKRVETSQTAEKQNMELGGKVIRYRAKTPTVPPTMYYFIFLLTL